jgi:hypothetical protein
LQKLTNEKIIALYFLHIIHISSLKGIETLNADPESCRVNIFREEKMGIVENIECIPLEIFSGPFGRRLIVRTHCYIPHCSSSFCFSAMFAGQCELFFFVPLQYVLILKQLIFSL